MARYKWVRHPWSNGERLFAVGILSDGTLHNPNGYPEDVVRAAVTGADERRHERRSKAATKAAVTRRRRKEKAVARIAERILRGAGVGPQDQCAICGRHLDDPQSVQRGVGSECWGELLGRLTAAKRESDQILEITSSTEVSGG